jgi:hypothetical protein
MSIRNVFSGSGGNDAWLSSLDSTVLGGVERKEHPTGTRPLRRVFLASAPQLGPFL